MLQYLLKLTISLSIVYLFYQLFLRRLTFYNWNRWYLLIYSMVCFIIPFINVFTIVIGQPALRDSAIVNYIPAITQMETDDTSTSVGINWWMVAAVVFLIGILVMIARLGLQYYSLYKMRSKAVLLYDNKVKLYHIDAPVMPFSFGRGIYVNRHQHSEQELKEIIRHEFIHVKQRHSLDIIWSELLCILNWYNPFAWLLRHDMRQNLEFIADQQVLQTGLDRKQYQYLLLKVIGVNSFSIANNFNFSSLKKRIAMMNKTQSARVHLIRFLFLLPLLVVVLLAFRNSTQTHRQSLQTLVTDTVPAAEKIPPGLKDVENIDVSLSSNKVTVTLKNKKVETYDLNNSKEKDAFEEKYGPVPVPPPPPPLPGVPAAPKAPQKTEVQTIQIEPVTPGVIVEKVEITETDEGPGVPEKVEMAEQPNIIAHQDYGNKKLVVRHKRTDTSKVPEAPGAPKAAAAPVPPPPPPPAQPLAPVTEDCYNNKGFCITLVDNRGEAIVIVKDKNNKIVQAVSLYEWNKDKQYEEKYGAAPRHHILVYPKVVTGYKATQVSVGEASGIKPGEVVKIKPVGAKVVSPSGTLIKVEPTNKVIVTPSNQIMVVRVARPPVEAKKVSSIKLSALKPPTEASKTTLTNLTPLAKPAAEAKEAAEAKAKAEGQAKKAEKAKPATQSKEQ